MSEERNTFVREYVQAKLGDSVEAMSEFRGELTLQVPQEKIVEVCQFLRDDDQLRYAAVQDIVADDFLDDYPRFQISYHLLSHSNKHRIRVRCGVEDPDEGPPTVSSLWKVGEWLEMEVYDLMGIKFAGNGALRRLFLPQDWQGFPLRKDYPLGYEEVQFSFNYEEIGKTKPAPKD